MLIQYLVGIMWSCLQACVIYTIGELYTVYIQARIEVGVRGTDISRGGTNLQNGNGTIAAQTKMRNGN